MEEEEFGTSRALELAGEAEKCCLDLGKELPFLARFLFLSFQVSLRSLGMQFCLILHDFPPHPDDDEDDGNNNVRRLGCVHILSGEIWPRVSTE